MTITFASKPTPTPTGLAAVADGVTPDIARPIGGALMLLITGIVTSVLFNVPSNLAIVAAGDPTVPGFDAAQVRADFDEIKWVRWNHVRAVTATTAFGLLAWAFRLQGKASS